MSEFIARPFVEEALACGRAAEVDVKALLQAQNATNLDALTPADFARVWLALSDAMSDEFFGLGARPMRPGSATLMGHAVRDAATLDIALQRALRFLRVVLDEPYGVLSTDGQICTIILHESGPMRSAFAYRTFFLILHGFTCWLARAQVPLIAVEFRCDAPKGQTDYDRFLGVPVQFGTKASALRFHAKYLQRAVRRNEQELKLFLRTTPEAFLRGYRDNDALRTQIIDTCLRGQPADWPDAGAIARQLGMSRSSLQRRLATAGQSIGDIKQDLRRTLATKLLRQSRLSVAQIAMQLGYAEERAFYRAFKTWHHMTPTQYRSKVML